MEESRDYYIDVDIDVLFQGEEEWGRRISFFLEERKNREGKGGKYLEKISPKIVKDIEKSRFRFRSRSQYFCQFLEGFGLVWFWTCELQIALL